MGRGVVLTNTRMSFFFKGLRALFSARARTVKVFTPRLAANVANFVMGVEHRNKGWSEKAHKFGPFLPSSGVGHTE